VRAPACRFAPLAALALAACAGSGGFSVSECVGEPGMPGAVCATQVPGAPPPAPSYSISREQLWVNPVWSGKRYTKVFVVAFFRDPATRQAMEDELVRQLGAMQGVQALPSYVFHPSAENTSAVDFVRSLKNSGTDAVVFAQVTAKDTESVLPPAAYLPVEAPMAPEFGNLDPTGELASVYSNGYNPMLGTAGGQIPSPEITTVTLRSRLIQVQKPAVIFVGSVQGPPVTPATAPAAAGAIVSGMTLKDLF
jgi:hypothetical protein